MFFLNRVSYAPKSDNDENDNVIDGEGEEEEEEEEEEESVEVPEVMVCCDKCNEWRTVPGSQKDYKNRRFECAMILGDR